MTNNHFQTVDEMLDLFFKNRYTAPTFQRLDRQNVKFPVDIYANDTGLYFQFALVGEIDKQKDLQIKTDANNLMVKYTKPQQEQKKDTNYILSLIKRQSFDYQFKIDSKYNTAKVSAQLQNGLLTICIPLNQQATPKSITIK